MSCIMHSAEKKINLRDVSRIIDYSTKKSILKKANVLFAQGKAGKHEIEKKYCQFDFLICQSPES